MINLPTISRSGGLAILSALLFASVLATPSWADNFQQKHPRRAEVLRRDNGLNRQISNDRGQLGGHYGQLQRQDQGIRRQEQRDARMNGGYITSGQQTQLNREENGLQRRVDRDNSGNPIQNPNPNGNSFAQNHPRRAEVLGRDNRLNNQISNDRGDLSGQYSTLKQEDRSIRSQEQQDASQNGGFISTTQQQQLNQEENQLQRQINQDNSRPGQ